MTDSTKPVVLVADDEPSTLALVASHLRAQGYTVMEASDGDHAWELATEHLPNLVVLDVMMPGMSGWEVCRKIREAVSLAHTGVVMLTGIGESLNEMTSPPYGADAYVDKPFEFSELDRQVRGVLARRRGGTLGRPAPESEQAASSAAVEPATTPLRPPRKAARRAAPEPRPQKPVAKPPKKAKKAKTKPAGKPKAATPKLAKKAKKKAPVAARRKKKPVKKAAPRATTKKAKSARRTAASPRKPKKSPARASKKRPAAKAAAPRKPAAKRRR
jgi:DNA-binding response OmpR family regulator